MRPTQVARKESVVAHPDEQVPIEAVGAASEA